MSYEDMPVPPDFEPRKYAVQDEYQPVDPFDIPASQQRLAQPTPLKPYNPFVLVALWLTVLNVFTVVFTLILLITTHALFAGLFWVVAALAGFIWGVPAVIGVLVGLYQLSFIGFEKGKALAWTTLVFALAGVVVAIVGTVEIVDALIQVAQAIQKLQTALGGLGDLTKLR